MKAQAQSVSKVCFYFSVAWVILTFPQPASATVKGEITDAALQRPFLAPSTGARGRAARRSKDQELEKTHRKPRLPRSSAISSKRIKKSPSTDEPFEVLPGGISSESGIEPSSSGTDTDFESICPKFTITTELSDDLPEKSNTVSDFLQSSSDTFGSEYFSSPMETSAFLDLETAACGANLDMLMTVEEHRLLNQDERTALYNLIDNSMPHAHGIEESSGTYDFYMNEQSYFDPLLPINRPVRLAKLGVQEMSESSMDYGDVRNWLSEEIDLFDVGLDGRHAFRNEFDPSVGFSDILYSLDDTCGTINESTAHLHMRVQSQYSSERSIDIDAINNEVCTILCFDYLFSQIGSIRNPMPLRRRKTARKMSMHCVMFRHR